MASPPSQSLRSMIYLVGSNDSSPAFLRTFILSCPGMHFPISSIDTHAKRT